MATADTLPRVAEILVECADRTVVVLAPFHHFNTKGLGVYRGYVSADLAGEATRITLAAMTGPAMLELELGE